MSDIYNTFLMDDSENLGTKCAAHMEYLIKVASEQEKWSHVVIKTVKAKCMSTNVRMFDGIETKNRTVNKTKTQN